MQQERQLHTDFVKVARLTESGNKTLLPTQESALIYSQVKSFEHQYYKPTLSFKYVINGEESYVLDGHTFLVRSGQYLLVNNGRNYYAGFDNKQFVSEGMCIYLNMNTLQDVLRTLSSTPSDLLDTPENWKNNDLQFVESIYKADNNELGIFFKKIANYLSNFPDEDLPATQDFYYKLAEILLFSQERVLSQVNRLDTIKISTRQELFRRLEVAKEYIEAHYTQKIDISEIAKEAAISEYHFFRSFKKVYGVSPYQYILKKRMKRAIHLLTHQNTSVTETAYLTGFSDIHAFSKSFKKEYQISPLELVRKKVKI